MADILYVYRNQVYANITNLCDCRCTFCIRSHGDGVGDAETLWHKADPTLEEIKAAMDEFDFDGRKELVYCGYGEPTCALENLVESARYAKEKYGMSIRVNTNGLGNLYHNKDIIPILAEVVDSVSISLNAPTREAYINVTRPRFENAFEGMLDFTSECKDYIQQVKLTIVDVLSEEEIKASQELADSLGVELRIRRFAG
ncbi:TIGR04100 family radical SAM protein [Faecalicatena contorta]|uniref:Radical SAM enzyme, TIGR04100 family n=1 Tax=Faecalicatena contorta TaxID=39482 RepID=A0A315ZY62_9FIRM|nr:TIGR04100 family radical SAM protein [Faecalicatena contorta]PWJ50616.1 radical SAM enzyme (TIGR04100 family) [Faecalicatena contorta]SUQ14024.1 radical SAM enzyme, TIGR04100 family [Faecalicatena contorta]